MSKYLGIIDWGIGGLGVYSALKKNTNIPVIYFSDSGHLPYGKTDHVSLKSRLDAICDFLHGKGAEKVAIACNAASAAFPDNKDVRGIISHGADAIKDGGWENVGLIAGLGTVESNIYKNLLEGTGINLHQRVAQPLSAHVEAGRLGGQELAEDLVKILSPIRDSDAILMACTHYPVIENEIAKHVSSDCKLVDPAGNMAEWIQKEWEFVTETHKDQWFTTGNPTQFAENANLAFNVNVGAVTRLNNDFSLYQ